MTTVKYNHSELKKNITAMVVMAAMAARARQITQYLRHHYNDISNFHYHICRGRSTPVLQIQCKQTLIHCTILLCNIYIYYMVFIIGLLYEANPAL